MARSTEASSAAGPARAAEATSIPVLPCASLDETLDFYRLLGFETTYRQASPNPYAVAQRDGAQLHFAGVKGLDPARAYTTCLFIVPEVERLHQGFAEGLRAAYGRLPVAGVPRISRMRPGQSRFTVVDPAGNSVIFIRRDAPDDYDEGPGPAPTSPLARALRAAARLRDFKNDDRAAAKVLEVALARAVSSPPLERARALAALAELSAALGDEPRLASSLAELRQVPLPDDERARHRDELEAAERLLQTHR
jgi:catechol 2,3-dioxygenase-like lactoylglutathione lyase family enzyme